MAAPGSRKPSRVASRAIRLRSLAQNNNVSLAGGTRSRPSPSLHAGVAITVPRSGALLTGLATAVGPASRRVPRRRYADALAAASFPSVTRALRAHFIPRQAHVSARRAFELIELIGLYVSWTDKQPHRDPHAGFLDLGYYSAASKNRLGER
jgi:hypothetical protein